MAGHCPTIMASTEGHREELDLRGQRPVAATLQTLNPRTLRAPRDHCPPSPLGSEGRAGGLDLGPQCWGVGNGIFEVAGLRYRVVGYSQPAEVGSGSGRQRKKYIRPNPDDCWGALAGRED